MFSKSNETGTSFSAEDFKKMLDNWTGFQRIPTEKIFKEMEYRVCLENLFQPHEYQKLSKIEKRRIKNINRNMTFMLAIGMGVITRFYVFALYLLQIQCNCTIAVAILD